MQLFPCPFCGPRAETEFHYRGETGIPRPEGADVSDETWTNYLYMRRNARGKTSEIWLHLACGEFFSMVRDSVTHEIVSASALPYAETCP